MKRAIATIVAGLLLGFGAGAYSKARTAERRGCCSHHGGVCGCKSGSATCCDGSLSPTCGCD